MPSMRTSSTKAAYPEFNQSASRMAAALGEDIEVAQPDTPVARAQAPLRAIADQDEAHASTWRRGLATAFAAVGAGGIGLLVSGAPLPF